MGFERNKAPCTEPGPLCVIFGSLSMTANTYTKSFSFYIKAHKKQTINNKSMSTAIMLKHTLF